MALGPIDGVDCSSSILVAVENKNSWDEFRGWCWYAGGGGGGGIHPRYQQLAIIEREILYIYFHISRQPSVDILTSTLYLFLLNK